MARLIQALKPRNWDILLLFVFGCLVFFLNSRALEPSLMEARNFVTAREIQQSGNWLMPTMNGELRLAKPPLPTWFSAFFASFEKSGEDLALLRFPAGLAGLLLVGSFFLFVQRFTESRRLAFLSAAVCVSSYLVINSGRTAIWDIYCHAFMMAAITAFHFGMGRQGRSFLPFPFLLFGVFLGLSFASKGPVAFYGLLLPFLVPYVFAFGFEAFRAKRKEIALSLIPALLLSFAWPLYLLAQKAPELLNVVENEGMTWINRHREGPLFYIWRLPLMTGLWAFFAVAGFIPAYARPRIQKWANYRFFLGWTLLALLLLSLIPEKKERYLLPAMIPLAGVIGMVLQSLLDRFRKREEAKGDRILVLLFTIFLAASGVGLAFLILHKSLSYDPWRLALPFLLFAGLAFCFWRKRALPLLMSLHGVLLIWAVIAVVPHLPQLARKNPDYRSLHEVRAFKELKDHPLYSIGPMNMKLIWDIGRPVKEWNLMALSLYTPPEKEFILFSQGDIRPLLTSIHPGRFDMRVIDRIACDPKDEKTRYFVNLLRQKEGSEISGEKKQARHGL